MKKCSDIACEPGLVNGGDLDFLSDVGRQPAAEWTLNDVFDEILHETMAVGPDFVVLSASEAESDIVAGLVKGISTWTAMAMTMAYGGGNGHDLSALALNVPVFCVPFVGFDRSCDILCQVVIATDNCLVAALDQADYVSSVVGNDQALCDLDHRWACHVLVRHVRVVESKLSLVLGLFPGRAAFLQPLRLWLLPPKTHDQ